MTPDPKNIIQIKLLSVNVEKIDIYHLFNGPMRAKHKSKKKETNRNFILIYENFRKNKNREKHDEK